jgi:hypothetical protein
VITVNDLRECEAMRDQAVACAEAGNRIVREVERNPNATEQEKAHCRDTSRALWAAARGICRTVLEMEDALYGSYRSAN